MPKFKVEYSDYVVVDANSEQEAIHEAWQQMFSDGPRDYCFYANEGDDDDEDEDENTKTLPEKDEDEDDDFNKVKNYLGETGVTMIDDIKALIHAEAQDAIEKTKKEQQKEH